MLFACPRQCHDPSPPAIAAMTEVPDDSVPGSPSPDDSSSAAHIKFTRRIQYLLQPLELGPFTQIDNLGLRHWGVCDGQAITQDHISRAVRPPCRRGGLYPFTAGRRRFMADSAPPPQGGLRSSATNLRRKDRHYDVCRSELLTLTQAQTMPRAPYPGGLHGDHGWIAVSAHRGTTTHGSSIF